ncbi:hypothetical protein ABZ990_00800 [Streptomyces sp. NPDC046203]|uniref:hypothetical protein n=1 Tax=Streptomyces sp. NPDC046203 TaxID=3154602 RepID=UPI0033F59425
MDITVQWVRTFWTKESRGGPAATRRNALPAGFPLPDEVPYGSPGASGSFSPPLSSPSSGFAHYVEMAERDGFAPRPMVRNLDEVGLRLRDEGDRLRVLARVEPLCGVPPRRRRPPAVRLLPGQWVRWQLNYRFSSAVGLRDWLYWLDTFNIAYGPRDRDVFLTEPTVLIDERGSLR